MQALLFKVFINNNNFFNHIASKPITTIRAKALESNGVWVNSFVALGQDATGIVVYWATGYFIPILYVVNLMISLKPQHIRASLYQQRPEMLATMFHSQMSKEFMSQIAKELLMEN